MSLNLARQATLTASRGTRQMSTQAKVLAERAVSATKHNASFSTWKNASLFIAIPCCFAVGYKAFFIAEHPHPEEFQAFDHLRIRRKAFPWGDGQHSLFHTDEANVLTDGWKDGFGPGHAHH